MKVFQDAKNSSLSLTNKLLEAQSQTAKSIQKPHITDIKEILEHGGDLVSVFDLIETFCHLEPANELTLQIIGRLEPEHFLALHDEQLEQAGLLFLKMKVSYKLQ